MNCLKNGRRIALASAGLMICLACEPMLVSASTGGILQSGGVAALLESSRSEEEYIQVAEEAKGASWGYTNILGSRMWRAGT